MPIQARNGFVFIIRDETEKEKSGLVIPGQGQEKPNKGTLHSIGEAVQDKQLRKDKGKKCIFFKGTGWDIEYEGQTFLVLEGERVIGVDESSK